MSLRVEDIIHHVDAVVRLLNEIEILQSLRHPECFLFIVIAVAAFVVDVKDVGVRAVPVRCLAVRLECLPDFVSPFAVLFVPGQFEQDEERLHALWPQDIPLGVGNPSDRPIVVEKNRLGSQSGCGGFVHVPTGVGQIFSELHYFLSALYVASALVVDSAKS